MANYKLKGNFIDGLFITIAVCVFSTGLFWAFFQNSHSIIELIGVFGTNVTIVGFLIGLWQLAKLRNDREVIQRTRIKSRLEYVIKNKLKDIQEDFTTLNPDEEAIKKYIDRLSKIRIDFYEIEAEHNNEINCNNCHDKINLIISNLDNILKSKNKQTALATLNKQQYIQDFADFIKEVIEIESTLQND